MNLKHALFGERSVTKVAAVFENRGLAETAILRLRQESGMEASQVNLVGPDDMSGVVEAPLSRKLEPERTGIAFTLIRTHLLTGAIGVAAGGLLYLGFRVMEHPAVISSPFLSLGLMLFYGAVFGMLFGGLLSLRPDHYRVMAAVRKAIKRGRWAVVGHPVNHEQTRLALKEMRRRSNQVVRSF